jgi:Putative metal-binding motif
MVPYMKGVVGVAALALFVFGCAPLASRQAGDGGVPPGGVGGNGPTPPPDLAPPDPTFDYDHDGASMAQGDCNDWDPLVGPNAIEVAGNHIDDDCDGMVDETEPPCDPAAAGKTDAPSLAAGLDACDARFVVAATLAGPSDERARNVVPAFGVLTPTSGQAMVLLSTGLAQDKAMAGAAFVKPQNGTSLGMGNTAANPEPRLPGSPSCGSGQPPTVNDYSELVLRLKAPQNAKSFSFQFHFFSAEFPEYVCSTYNDEFLVEMQSPNEYPMGANISFDMQKNPITVNNGFFTVCQNDPGKAETQHCTHPVSDIAGTGYEDTLADRPIGGSTGWLTTTAPVTPGEELTLRFIIFDEGDHIYDSSVLIDHFQWSVTAVGGPSTIP